MRILRLTQGSPEWHQHRATRFNASDAPAMLGESPHMTRDELLQRMVTGLSPDVDGATQRRFDDGHAVEALLRPMAEKMLGEPLHAFVAVPDDESSNLSASYDGCTFVGDTTAESKLLNARLRAAFADMETIAPEHRERAAAKSLPIDYRIQMEQQVRIAGAERSLFLTGELRDDGTLGDVFSCWYYPDDALWARIQAGWAQFAEDRKTYVAREVAPKVTAAPLEALPAISARIEGSLAIHSNLDVFGKALRTYIDRIPAKPSTDQEFADCDAACKALKRAEEALDGAEANALGQVQSVEQLTRTIADLRNVARTARLASEKVVKARKDQIRVEECQRGRRALDEHIRGLIQQIGAPYMPEIVADFGAAISGLKSLDSLRAKVDQLLADKKIDANEIAGRITLNLRTMKSHGDYDFLFSDLKSIITKQPDDFQALVQSRVLAHQAEEKRRAEAAAEKERERIRAEELAKLQREQKELDRETARQTAAMAIAAATPAPAPIAPPAVSQKPEAANSPTVVPITRGNATLKIGDIQEAFGLPITAAFIESTLKIAPAKRENRAVWFYDTDFDRIRQALMFHIERAPAPKQMEEAA
jgi:predicted phage-related endonuclease